ncbi:MAG: glycosyltransferase [Burkholderiales bacterium]|nr:MAG: glycosyltransferase [Burkholderiales bacterium]
MRILLTSTSFPETPTDWKGLFILRMIEALARQDGLELAAWLPPGPLPAGVKRATTPADEAWLKKLLDNGGIAHLLRHQLPQGILAATRLLWRQRQALSSNCADVFHINWLQNALAMPSNRVPALVTVLGTDMQLLRIPGVRTLLRRSFRTRPVVICPNASWMQPELQEAFGDLAMIRFVPFGIDARWYEVERNFESNKREQWLCVSRLTADKIGSLFEWTEPFFKGGQAELHLFGPMQEQLEIPEWVQWHGPVAPDDLRENWFPSAQGLITLSRHAEGRPQVILEAMASGLPIIASPLPAHDELLSDHELGVLCSSPAETFSALQTLAESGANRAMGVRGRARMLAEAGTWEDCASRYATLYRQLLEQTRHE